MATITDLTNVTWIPNHTVEYPVGWVDKTFYVDFNCTLTDESRNPHYTGSFIKFECLNYAEIFGGEGYSWCYDIVLNNCACGTVGNGDAAFTTSGGASKIPTSLPVMCEKTTFNSSLDKVNFIGGTDATNLELITWLEANGELQAKETPAATITYNGNVIGQLAATQKAILPCANEKALTDITIKFISAGSIIYNGVETKVEAGKTAVLSCAGEIMKSDVVVSIVEGSSETLPVWNGTDLTGTTWNIPSGWSAPAGYAQGSGVYGHIKVTANDNLVADEDFESYLCIGYYLNFDTGGTRAEADSIVYSRLTGWNQQNITPIMSFEIAFTEDYPEDNDHNSLISWLKQYGTLTSHQMPAPALITFTIGDTEYQAEEGMTWAEWCESDYNTDGWVADNLISNTGFGIITVNDSNGYTVHSDDVIKADAVYIPSRIGSND